nr:hypothetical protein [Nitrosomonas nitrosa]
MKEPPIEKDRFGNPRVLSLEKMLKEQGCSDTEIEAANARLWRYIKLVRKQAMRLVNEEHQNERQREANRRRLTENGDL